MSWRLPTLNTWISTKIFVTLRNCILPMSTFLTYVLQGKLCPTVAKCIKIPACAPSIQSCLIFFVSQRCKDTMMEFKNFLGLHCPQAPLALLCDNLLGPKEETSLQLWREWPSCLPGLCRLLWCERHPCWGHSWWPGIRALSLCSQHLLQSSQSLNRNVVEKHLPQCSSSVLFCVLRTRCCSSEHFKHLCSPSKFSSCCCLSMFTVLWAFLKWDSWTRWVPPGATSTCNSLGKRSEELLVSPPLFTVGWGSLYLLCFSGRLDSLDLQCLAGRAGEVIGECLTDLELSLRFCF